MIVGLGVDLVAVGRIAEALRRHGDRLLARCFAPGELTRPWDPEHVAGVFAAKEAALKALGTGWGQGVGWHDVAVAKDEAGRPSLTFSGNAQARAQALGVRQAHLTIAHERTMALAVVVLEA